MRKLLYDDFQCLTQTTGGYSLLLNGKAERHIRTLECMERRTICDATLPSTLWSFSLDASVDVYGSLHHSAINESPHFLLSGKCRSINEFRVWGCYMEALKEVSLSIARIEQNPGTVLELQQLDPSFAIGIHPNLNRLDTVLKHDSTKFRLSFLMVHYRMVR